MTIKIGDTLMWRPKGKLSEKAVGVVSQWRPAPDRVEIVKGKGFAYGQWVNLTDVEYEIINKEVT